MSDDIVVVVPPGTRVRYIENAYTDGKVLVVDAHALRPFDDVRPRFTLGAIGDLCGVPVYDGEKWTTP